jgi:PAS domain S-box-containing protein
LLTANPAFEQIYGWKQEELVGKPLPVIPSEWKEERKNMLELLQKGDSLVGYETKDQCRDGTIIDVEMTLSPLFDEKGHVTAIFTMTRDITEKNALNQTLRNTDKLTLAGEMAASVAHEIRNPLASKGFVQLMQESDQKFQTYTSIILSELERINNVMGEFLVLAKPHSGKLDRSSIASILTDVLTLFKNELHLHNIRLKTDWPEEDLELVCDPNQLKQVFINLVKNSIEAMPNGGELSLSAIPVHKCSHVLITLQDTGNGIPEHLLPLVSKPFFTTKEQGTGLGLMIINKIIEQH